MTYRPRTYYLRNGDSILADLEASEKDLHVVIKIKQYSQFLLSLNVVEHMQFEFVCDMARLQELRGEWFESLRESYPAPHPLIEDRLKVLAKKWGLHYSTD